MYQEFIITNISDNTVQIEDLGLMLEPGDTIDLTQMYDMLTILNSSVLKELVVYERISLNDETGINALVWLENNNIAQFTGYYLTWAQFKNFIGKKENVAIYFDFGCKYHIFSPLYPYFTYVKKGDDSRTPEQADFEDNYKEWCDNVKLARADGKMRVHATTLMEDEHPVFTGCADGVTRDHCGINLQIEMPNTPGAVVVRDMLFTDTIRLEDGTIMYENAPWGAILNVEVLHPGYPDGMGGWIIPPDTPIRRFVKNVPIYRDNYFGMMFDTDCPGSVTTPLKLRIRINNPIGRSEASSIDFNGADATALAGKYFLLSSVSNKFYVWYNVNETNEDPMVSERIGLRIDLDADDSAETIATKTMQSIHNYMGQFTVEQDGTLLKIYVSGRGDVENINSGTSGLSVGVITEGIDDPEFEPWKVWGWVKIHRKYTTVMEEMLGL